MKVKVIGQRLSFGMAYHDPGAELEMDGHAANVLLKVGRVAVADHKPAPKKVSKKAKKKAASYSTRNMTAAE